MEPHDTRPPAPDDVRLQLRYLVDTLTDDAQRALLEFLETLLLTVDRASP